MIFNPPLFFIMNKIFLKSGKEKKVFMTEKTSLIAEKYLGFTSAARGLIKSWHLS